MPTRILHGIPIPDQFVIPIGEAVSVCQYLGSRLIHIQKATRIASATAERKFLASLSYRVATRLKSLMRQKAFSTRWRSRYLALSWTILRLRLERPGMTGTFPAWRRLLRIALAS